MLREAEYRSTALIPYWNFPPAKYLVPRQRKCTEALEVINETLDELIAKCKALVMEEDQEFVEEFLSEVCAGVCLGGAYCWCSLGGERQESFPVKVEGCGQLTTGVDSRQLPNKMAVRLVYLHGCFARH